MPCGATDGARGGAPRCFRRVRGSDRDLWADMHVRRACHVPWVHHVGVVMRGSLLRACRGGGGVLDQKKS